MKISELGEQTLIKEIASLVRQSELRQMVGIGDDAALAQVKEGLWLATTTDMLVEGVHFVLPQIEAAALGYKALAVNVSDIAAMGGQPRHAFISLALPKSTEVEFIFDFYRGMVELAKACGVAISGGDTVGSPGPLVINITVQGEVRREQALLRSGARPGDILCTTGPLGASVAGLQFILHDVAAAEPVRRQALAAHYYPTPRVSEGLFLAHSGAVTAAMDISDGLVKDAGEICAQSSCGITLAAEDIPIHPVAVEVAQLRGLDPLDFALHGGEDYELLFTVNPQRLSELTQAYTQRFAKPFHPIGRITAERGISMVTKEQKWVKLEFKGYQHF